MTTYIYTTIASPGSISSVAMSINDSGQIGMGMRGNQTTKLEEQA